MRRFDTDARGAAKGVQVTLLILVIVVAAVFVVRYFKTSEQSRLGYSEYRPGLDAVIGEKLGAALAEAMGGSGDAVIIAQVKLSDRVNQRARTRASAARETLEKAGVSVVSIVEPTPDELRSFGWSGSMTEGIAAGYLADLAAKNPGMKGILSLPGYPSTHLDALQPLIAKGVKLVAFDEGNLKKYDTLIQRKFLVAVVTMDPDSEYEESDFEDLETQAEEAFSKIYQLIRP